MNPEKLGIEAEDFEALQKEKFTQTDGGYIKRTLCPEPPPEVEKVDKGSVTVFEYCQIIQNPEHPRSVTIIKETVREETTSDSSYKLCKQIIEPFVRYKPDCLECEDDDILQAALKFAEEDYPCHQPCLQIPDIEINTKGKDDLSDIISILKVNAYTSYSSMDKVEAADKTDDDLPFCEDEEEPKTLPKCPPKSPPQEPEEAKCIPKCSPRDPDCPGQPPTCHPRDPDCLPADERGCAQPTPPELEPEVKPKKSKFGKKCSMTGLEVGTPVIMASSISSSDSTEKKQCLGDKTSNCNPTEENPIHEKTFTEAHNEAITTIKVAMEDFIGKVYKSTQDAVTLIATDSAQRLIKKKASEIFSTDKEENDESKSSETIKMFGIFRRETQESQESEKGKYGPGAAAINNIVSKVDSAVTIISEQVTKKFDKFPEKILPTSYNNKSSPYDKPRPPSDVAHKFLPEPEPAHSVFSVIKSKIFSMFGDSEAKSEDVLSRTASNISSSNEDDDDNDDIIERVID